MPSFSGTRKTFREKHNCQPRAGTRGLIDRDVSPRTCLRSWKGRNAAGWSEAGAQRPRTRTHWASGRSKPAGGRGRSRIQNDRLSM